MGSLYYDLVGILRNAGCVVQENSITNGWQRRARSSGGFSAPPLGVWWHHTASNTTPENDLSWQINGCPDAPVGNLLLDRNGVWWPVAGGASNCAGKGGPANFSRGTSLTDQGNTTGFQAEVANAGTGQAWPQVQIDAYFKGSNALNAHVGNQPTDIISHAAWTNYTRKIDPATAAAVQGPWQPRSVNSSGTWNLDDMKAECARRAGSTPDPGPGPGPSPIPPGDDDEMMFAGYWVNPNDPSGAVFLALTNNTKQWMTDGYHFERSKTLWAERGVPGDQLGTRTMEDMSMFAALGIVQGPIPVGHDEWGNWVG